MAVCIAVIAKEVGAGGARGRTRGPPEGLPGAPSLRAGRAGSVSSDRLALPALQNYPLYIKSIPTENELKFHYTVHTSLDVVDEKVSALGKALVDQRELYLGLLYPTEDYKVYPCPVRLGGGESASRESESLEMTL